MNYNYIDEFLDYIILDRNYSNNTYLSYKNDLDKFIKYYKNKDILSITSKELEDYINTLCELSPSSISHNISAIKSFYTYYLKVGKISYNPSDVLKEPKLGTHLPNYLTENEVNKLLDIKINSPFDARNKAILELMYATGLRISETVNLEFNNIDLDECIVRVMGKGSKERIVPINDYAIDALTNYIKNYRPLLVKKDINNYIFLNNHGKKMTRQAVFKIIKSECLKKNIKKDISPHTLRHTFATHLYTHVTNDKLKKDYEEYFPRK